MDTYDFMFASDAAAGAVCDFCSYPRVHWAYPCRDHAQKTEHAEAVVLRRDGSLSTEAIDIDGFSRGGWAACSVCHALIERGDRDRLARRSARRMQRKLIAAGTAMSLPNLQAHIRRLQDQFWTNREGPAVPTTPSERRDPTR